MLTRNRMIGACAVVATLAMTGCAATWDGPGPRVGIAPGPALSLASASCGVGGAQPAPMASMASGAWITGVMPRIRAVQMRLGSAGSAQMNWKRVATGDC